MMNEFKQDRRQMEGMPCQRKEVTNQIGRQNGKLGATFLPEVSHKQKNQGKSDTG